MEKLNKYSYELKLSSSTIIIKINEIISTNLEVEKYHQKEKLMGRSSSANRDSDYRPGRSLIFASTYYGDLSKGIITNATALGSYIIKHEDYLEMGSTFTIKNQDGNYIEYEVMSKKII